MSESQPRRRPVRPVSARQPKISVNRKRKAKPNNSQGLIIGFGAGGMLLLIMAIAFSGLLSKKHMTLPTAGTQTDISTPSVPGTNNFPPANDSPQRILDDEYENFVANAKQLAGYMTGQTKSGFGEYMKKQREQMATLGERKLFVSVMTPPEYDRVYSAFSKKIEAERTNLGRELQKTEQIPATSEIDPEFKAFSEEMLRFQKDSLVSFLMESSPLMKEFEPGKYPEFSQFLTRFRQMCGELATLRHRNDWSAASTQLSRIKAEAAKTSEIPQRVDQARYNYRNVLLNYLDFVASEIDATPGQSPTAVTLSNDIRTHLNRFDYRDPSTSLERDFKFRVTPECQNQVREIMIEKDLSTLCLSIV